MIAQLCDTLAHEVRYIYLYLCDIKSHVIVQFCDILVHVYEVGYIYLNLYNIDSHLHDCTAVWYSGMK